MFDVCVLGKEGCKWVLSDRSNTLYIIDMFDAPELLKHTISAEEMNKRKYFQVTYRELAMLGDLEPEIDDERSLSDDDLFEAYLHELRNKL